MARAVLWLRVMTISGRVRPVRALPFMLLALAACTDGSGDSPNKVPGDNAEDFISAVPGQSTGGDEDSGAEEPSAGDDGGDGDSPERAIAEADILKVDGDKLYALSRYAGLSIIDIANPTSLELLGNYRTNAMPFEMYVESGVAYIMYSDWGSYDYDEASQSFTWHSASHMLALDVSKPATIRRIAEETVPGTVSDSRKVGDIIYLVTYENGYCWDCSTKPRTRVVSFDASDRTKFSRVDEVSFEGDEYSYQRSISVNQQRIYVAGPSWEDKDSDIQVVDIADPGGDLKLGATIPIHGSVESRWQMDEYEGTLRVITQPTPWRSNDPPHVQTFTVTDSNTITALADLPVVLPRPEDLRSVRFDGDRAYAITFEQIDPLFTFDLSDPAEPKQVGELEIPGFVVHMEPRGDRVYALGNDWDSPDGALHVSIFDVSDLAAPTMLSRVNFGGDWAWVAEDQDRIHKAFNLALEQNSIFVPFGGGSYADDSCSYSYQSGIQIIDVANDALTLRGVAPQLGEARRSFLHQDRLFGVTDNAVQVFDITDRDAPTELEMLEVARNVSQVKVLGGKLMRFGTDWWTNRAVLDFTSLAEAGSAEPLAELDLSSVGDIENECQQNSYWDGNAFVHGKTAYVPRRSYRYTDNSYRQTLELFVVDMRTDEPKLVGSVELTGNDQERLGSVVLTDSALLVGRAIGYYDYNPETGVRSEPTYSYDVFDLADPLAPAFATNFVVPSTLSMGGWGYGVEDCGVDMGWGWWYGGYGSDGAIVSGDLVVSQHEVAVDDGTGRVRYFLDRLDVSNPAEPRLLAPINIPGQVVQFDEPSGRLLTVDYLYEETPATDWQDCYERGSGWFDETRRVCRIYKRRVNSLLVDDDVATRKGQLVLDGARISGQIAVSNERVFYTTRRPSYDSPTPLRVESLRIGADASLFQLPGVELPGVYWASVVARGSRAFLNVNQGLTVIDTSTPDAPVTKEHDLQGWGCSSLEVKGDRAYCALGMFGVETLDL